MTDFKVGDKVIGIKQHHGGERLTVLGPSQHGGFIRCCDGSGYTAMMLPSEIELVQPEPKFKVGDWVKVFGRGDNWEGTIGTVQKIEDSKTRYGVCYTIHKNDKGDDVKQVWSDNVLNFFEDQLVATEAPPKFAWGGVIPKPELGFYAKADAKLTAKVLGYFDGGKVSDPVNSPSHYTQYPVEVIELTRHMSFNRGNAVKYVARAGFKSKATEKQDIQKAIWYLQDELKELERKEAAK